ncbi:hypothetical protein P261_02182 [Lachnospiraceae bacterium TWA4]|nr:hypothetical protein P261_02182 [Lachnospiraceae bacterium TWA4]
MTNKEKNDYFYLCSLIEYIARKTKNKRRVIVNALGKDGIKKQLKDAQVNHCLSFEQVSDEIIEYYKIEDGDFDTIANCKYSIPSYVDIGQLYMFMIRNLAKNGDDLETLISVFNSFISDEISNFKTGVYFENLDYLQESYKAGYLLD